MRNSRMPTSSISDRKLRETIAWVVLCLILMVMAFFTVQLSLQKSQPEKEKTQAKKGETKEKTTPSTTKPTPTPQKDEGIGRIKVSVNGLNLRSSPDVGDNQIASLKEGMVLIVLSKEKSWYKVRTGDGAEGYVSSSPDYVEVIEMNQ